MSRFGETVQATLHCVDAEGKPYEIQVLRVQPVSRTAHMREHFAAEDSLVYQLADGRRIEPEGEGLFRVAGTEIRLRLAAA